MEVLDSNAKIRAELTYKNGAVFNKTMRILLGVICSFLLLAVLTLNIVPILIGLVFFPIGIYAFTAFHGTEISFSDCAVRAYTSSYGVKKGRWESTNLLPDITVMANSAGVVMSNMYAGGHTVLKTKIYQVVLLSANHRKKVIVCEKTDPDQAFEVAKMLAEKMDKKIVEFNPVISQQTMDRRYRR